MEVKLPIINVASIPSGGNPYPYVLYDMKTIIVCNNIMMMHCIMREVVLLWMLMFGLQQEELAILALKRMAVDMNNKVTVYYTKEMIESSEDVFIASASSPKQRVCLITSLSGAVYLERVVTFNTYTLLKKESLRLFRHGKITRQTANVCSNLIGKREDNSMNNQLIYYSRENNSKKTLIIKPSRIYILTDCLLSRSLHYRS